MPTASIYLDHAATTPPAPEVVEAMLPWLGVRHGNPSSLHRRGQRARAAVEEARERVAAAIGAAPAEIVFTSGATEALGLALRGVLASHPRGMLRVGATEHAAVLAVARELRAQGRDVDTLPPDDEGRVLAATVDASLAEGAADGGLVALMHTNNETGVVQEVTEAAEAAHRRGVLLACDAVQAFGYAPLDVRKLGTDLVALSAHKVRGPMGAGALWVRDGLELVPQQLGGTQERGLRAGTHDVPAIVGFGVAAERAAAGRDERARRTGRLRDRLEAGLLALEGVHLNGAGPRGPKHANLRFGGVDGEMLLMALDDLGVEASAGSACAAGSLEPSHVLMAMGASREAAKASVRFTLGEDLSEADVDDAIERVARAVARCRAVAA